MTLEEHLRGRKVIYVMRRFDFFKIGCSSDICRRYGSKRSLSTIILVIPVPDEMNIFSAEKMVHDLFREKNVDGFETFDLSPDDLNILEGIFFYGGKMEVHRVDPALLSL